MDAITWQPRGAATATAGPLDLGGKGLRAWWRRALAAWALVAVSGCGGGDGGSPPPPAAPTITTQPASLVIKAGAPAIFAVQATGSGPLGYEWRRNDEAIPGSSAATLTLAATTLADDGARFTVRVSNAVGSVDSRVAALTVQPVAITIQTQPQDQVVPEGGNATFSVTAQSDGVGPLSYQWFRDDAPIDGATSPSYTLTGVVAADDGARFFVRIGQAGSEATSVAAALRLPTAALVRGRLAAGDGYTLALRADGRGIAWGDNAISQLGDGPMVPGTANARYIEVAAHQVVACPTFGSSVAVGNDGLVYGWGLNANGQLGSVRGGLNLETITGPRALNGLDSVVQVACDGANLFAVRRDGTVWHWPGRLELKLDANNQPLLESTPAQVPGLENVRAISTSEQPGSNAVVVLADGTVWNLTATVSGGPTVYVTAVSASQRDGLADIVSASCARHCLYVDRSGRLWAQGANEHGQLGNGDRIDMALPVVVPGVAQVRAAAAGGDASVAITGDGALWAWGELPGTGQDPPLPFDPPLPPQRLTGFDDVIDLAVTPRRFGTGHIVVLRRDGTVWGWGSGDRGELGIMTMQYSRVPVQALGVNLN